MLPQRERLTLNSLSMTDMRMSTACCTVVLPRSFSICVRHLLWVPLLDLGTGSMFSLSFSTLPVILLLFRFWGSLERVRLAANKNRTVSFLGGVTRTLNLSYLKAMPIGLFANLFTILPPLSFRRCQNESLQSPHFNTYTNSYSPTHLLTRKIRHQSQDPQPSNAGRANDGHDTRHHDERGREDDILHVRASQGRRSDTEGAFRASGWVGFIVGGRCGEGEVIRWIN